MSPSQTALELHEAHRRAALVVGLGLGQSAAEAALAARATGESFARLVRRLGLAGEEEAARALASTINLPLIGRSSVQKITTLPERLNPRFLDEVDAAIVGEEDGRLTVAVADPDIDRVLHGVSIAARLPARAVAAPLGLIEEIRSRMQDSRRETTDLSGGDDADELTTLVGASREAPVVRLVDELIAGAARERASDLHIETYADRVRVRLRVDGVLRDWRELKPQLARAMVSRLKIMANLDIAERRLPQDGRTQVEVDGERYDLRVATTPTGHGENAVIRYLVDGYAAVDIDQVGLSQQEVAKVQRALASPFGLILVVGPTGAGKSTTLAAALTELNQPGRKLISIEDPVEYQINGVTQIPVKPSIGLTFASVLRSILRSDPDVIVVGELRDSETAEMATDAALTGHLVLTTLHANDAAGAVPRLIDLGVDASLIRSTLKLVVAQRLVRLLCPACRRPAADGGFDAVGCDLCDHTGYKGRTGIFELLVADPDVLALIRPGASTADFARFTHVGALAGLRSSALAKIAEGLTSRAEVDRVLGP